MTELAFDPESHTYSRGGVTVPHVTEILQDAGLIDTAWYTEWHAQRGQAVHEACRLDALDDLDEASLDPRIAPYLDAYRRFRAETGFEPSLLETVVESKRYRYAGRFDQFGVARGANGVLVDLKTERAQRWAGPQLEAYKLALLECKNVFAEVCWAVSLRGNGTYSLAISKGNRDRDVFLAANTIWHWRNDP